LRFAFAVAASSRLSLEELEAELRDGFVPAVAAIDDANRAYRRVIGTALIMRAEPWKTATTVLRLAAPSWKATSLL
jgi:hypothetical protein